MKPLPLHTAQGFFSSTPDLRPFSNRDIRGHPARASLGSKIGERGDDKQVIILIYGLK